MLCGLLYNQYVFKQVVNARSALLSNFEVLNLLRELDAEHIARTKTAIRVKKEGEATGKNSHDTQTEEISENLRTVELEAIQYLSADYQPTLHQSDAGVTQLVRGLQSFGLSKSEKLQIVNLAPAEPVELYVIVEELEDRLGDRMNDLLVAVSKSLHESAPGHPNATMAVPEDKGTLGEDAVEVYEEAEQETWEYDANAMEFDDMGEGAGVEGDLDVDDD
ncbi:RNA polymerase Rpb4-domain-containing protein [Suillus subalutaceus]|uniref:RNA polymerase Rpb4-domain-containing protein n=1 Tax=Suillus subalutaceus TaxID=48586 RepID=UPI001B86DE48|nr:RNA polymerase Rpb4-domain-containing protein [Suillus subalutaceus]KAG1869053.1 RNA polymerase Rpb4-domain-containing protein [Suillus subalutaceus]